MDNNFCFVTLTNEPYLNRAHQTIQELRTNGKYQGKIVVIIGDDLKDRVDYDDENVIIKYFPTIDKKESLKKLSNYRISDGREFTKTFQWQKTYCFHEYFKNWKKCCFIDAGMRIIKPVEKILDLECSGKLLAHSDAYPTYERTLSGQFESSYFSELFDELKNNYDLEIDYFQSTIMLYDTEIIEKDTFKILIDLSNKYYNTKTNEQAIFNLYFTCYKKVWEQLKIKDEETYYYDFFERNSQTYDNYIMLKYPKTL
jgi:hypothetical protein